MGTGCAGVCPFANVPVSSRARVENTLAMLEASDTQTLDTPVTQDSVPVPVPVLRDLIERMQRGISSAKGSQTGCSPASP